MKVRPLWLQVCCLFVLCLITTAYVGFSHMQHVTVAQDALVVRAGQPVAIVYKNGQDPYYHIHNGTAIQNVYDSSRWITFGLIATWPGRLPHREIIYVCRAATIGAGCHKEPETRRQWMLIKVLPYPDTYDKLTIGPAIGFKAGIGGPLNGSYRCFKPVNSACGRPDADMITEKLGTLYYLHYANPFPPHGLSSQYAKKVSDFKLIEGMLYGSISTVQSGIIYTD